MRSDNFISMPLRFVSLIQSGHFSLHEHVRVHALVSTAVLIRRYLASVHDIILDEADRMLNQEFINQVQEILAACSFMHQASFVCITHGA